jgi:SAM-dependent methyltransferase
MALPRLQLFEFNDLEWVGADLRDTIVESLGRGLRWGRTLTGLVEPFSEFLEAAGTDRVLDLCAGSGGPAEILAAELRRAGRPVPEVLLTDLFPRERAWARLEAEEPRIRGHLEPVDATAIPGELGAGRARAIINAFHHFPPAVAGDILSDAMRARAPIWVSEPFERNPLMFLAFAPFGLAALLANPVFTPERTVGKAVLSWGVLPLTLAVSGWDGVVSTLRAYEHDDLMGMVGAHAADYRWVHGHYRYPLGGRGYYFYGVPL